MHLPFPNLHDECLTPYTSDGRHVAKIHATCPRDAFYYQNTKPFAGVNKKIVGNPRQ